VSRSSSSGDSAAKQREPTAAVAAKTEVYSHMGTNGRAEAALSEPSVSYNACYAAIAGTGPTFAARGRECPATRVPGREPDIIECCIDAAWTLMR
jgi:hypothetical protein